MQGRFGNRNRRQKQEYELWKLIQTFGLITTDEQSYGHILVGFLITPAHPAFTD